MKNLRKVILLVTVLAFGAVCAMANNNTGNTTNDAAALDIVTSSASNMTAIDCAATNPANPAASTAIVNTRRLDANENMTADTPTAPDINRLTSSTTLITMTTTGTPLDLNAPATTANNIAANTNTIGTATMHLTTAGNFGNN